MALRRLRTRYQGRCAACGTTVATGTVAWWDPDGRRLTCEPCGQHPAPFGDGRPPTAKPTRAGPAAPSRAGGSAQARYDRLAAARAERTRATHPVLGGLILALTDEPQSTTAWASGAVGERKVAAVLDKLADKGGVIPLHDRRIPHCRANLDHLVVAASGVWVIDTKRYQGQVARKNVGSLFSADPHLFVGRRDCSKLVAAMAGQVAAVRSALGAEGAAVPVHPMLCFVDAEWSWWPRPFRLSGVTIAWPTAAASLLRRAGSITPAQASLIAGHLTSAFPPAT